MENGLGEPLHGLGELPFLLQEQAELSQAAGDAGLFAECLEGGQGLLVAPAGLGVLALVLMQHAQLVEVG